MRDEKYLELLAEKYPTEQAVCREIINLKAILSLPKGTEHFMSDLHGEYEAFCHILNNCSGVIREKVDLLFEDTLSDLDREEICTLIYYPVEKLAMIKKEGKNNEEWYRVILGELIDIARLFSSKYTRSKVRKAMPKEYAYILDELIHVQKDEDDNQLIYHRNILDTLLELQNADEFIEVLAGLIKRLAVDHLHIVGDIFDRGPGPHIIMDHLMEHSNVDFQWGNHDVVWMGAASGQKACIANVIRLSARYNNLNVLEDGYGINLVPLASFAIETYANDPCQCFRVHAQEDSDLREVSLNMKMHKAIAIIQFKLEGQVIKRRPEFNMDKRLLLDKIDYEEGTIMIEGKKYELLDKSFPTIDPNNPYELSEAEEALMNRLCMIFVIIPIFSIMAVCRLMRRETSVKLRLAANSILAKNFMMCLSTTQERDITSRITEKNMNMERISCGISGLMRTPQSMARKRWRHLSGISLPIKKCRLREKTIITA